MQIAAPTRRSKRFGEPFRLDGAHSDEAPRAQQSFQWRRDKIGSSSEISRFFGIVIAMYHRDHDPAHFHARYGGFKVTVRIAGGYVEGKFPRRAEALVLE